MTVLLGYNSQLGIRAVSTTAELAANPAEYVFAESFSFKREAERQVIEEIGNLQRSMRRQVQGNVTAMGTLVKAVDPNNGVGLYQYLQSGSITSASLSTALFTHTFSQDDEVPSATRLQFEVAPGGDSATARRFFNGVVESYSLNVAIGQVAKETWNFRFSDHGAVLNSVSAVSLTQTPPINFNKCVIKLGETITACSVVAARDIALNVNNNIIEDRALGTNTVNRFSHGLRTVEGTFNIVFENATLYNRFVNNTATAISVLLESTDATSNTNHSIEFKIPQAHFNGDTPDVGGSGEIIQPIQFSATYGSNAGYQLQIAVINTDTSITI